MLNQRYPGAPAFQYCICCRPFSSRFFWQASTCATSSLESEGWGRRNSLTVGMNQVFQLAAEGPVWATEHPTRKYRNRKVIIFSINGLFDTRISLHIVRPKRSSTNDGKR